MGWDFSTEPEFEETLDWIREFVDETIIPVDLLCAGLDQAELDALAGIALGLAVEGLMLAARHRPRTAGGRRLALEEDHRQQARPRPAPRRRVEGCRRLGDALAVPAGDLLADRLDHFPLARDDLERLRDVLAQLREPLGPAAAAGLRRLDHDPLARQVLRERLADGLAALEGGDLRLRLRRGGLGERLVLGGGGFARHRARTDGASMARPRTAARAGRAGAASARSAGRRARAGASRSPGADARSAPRCPKARPWHARPPLQRHRPVPRPWRGRYAGLRSRQRHPSCHQVYCIESGTWSKIAVGPAIIPPMRAARSGAGSASRSRPACRRAAPPRSRPCRPSAPAR